MNLKNLLHFPATFVPHDEGEPFIVIARHQPDVALGLRLTLSAFNPTGKMKWASILGTLSARHNNEPMSPTDANEIFIWLKFKAVGGECISESVWPLVAFPCSPAEVNKVYSRMRTDLARNYVMQLKELLEKSGSTLCMSRRLMESMIIKRLDNLMPEVTATCNDNPRFLFLSEQDALRAKNAQ